MTRVLPRINFHSSTLIRCLADLALVDTAEPGNAFAEQLGQWIHFADAISLSAVHGNAVPPKMQSEAGLGACAAAGVEFERIRAMLTNSVTTSCSPNAGKTHIPLPAPICEPPSDLSAAYIPYRRFYEAHQRDMELAIQPLRFNVRDALAKASPRLKKLAELDATLEQILREREGKLLSKVPMLLRKRFEQLFKEHRQKLDDVRQADHPVGWMQAGGWLARFCSDMQTLLLAELEFRLQPAMGLMEALNEETKQDTQ